MSNLSFLFCFAVYGLLFGLSGRASPFPLGLRHFRGFLDRMAAPEERGGSHPVKVFTRTATRGINHYFLSKRAQAGNGRENLCRHILKKFLVFPLRQIGLNPFRLVDQSPPSEVHDQQSVGVP